jgi:class 3 adenylate cyclase/predicted ATPase
VSDLEQWLREQGLEQYSKLFADNDVDFEALAHLAETDLERLGLSLGHRRKLLRALDARGSKAAPSLPAGAMESGPHSVDAREAERRQITVMFCDMVGSTELANLLDPEDTSALIRRYQDACAGAVARFGGHVAKFMGDGVLAYFGYPQANEDTPEHAVRSALAVIDAIGELKRPDGRALQVRIGIATGIVVIGDMIGTGSARERSIAGETPNLAARLQALAEPDEIIVGERTHQLLGNRFEYESLGERALKGYAAPVRVWRVLRVAAAETRFAATRTASGGAFVGRSEESSLLFDRWQLASQGKGQAVLISGEPGMGKSRLADMLFDRIAGESFYRVTCQCSPYHTNSALHPVIRHLERAAGFAPDDPDAVKLAKLEVMLGGTSASPVLPATTLIADLLSLPTDGYSAVDLAPPQRKAATLAVLVELLTQLASDAPVLLLLEDAHWIDPTTRELWTRLIDRIPAIRLLALVTARPEFATPWTDREHMSSLELTRLTGSEAAALVTEIAAPRVLEPALVDDIVAKSDGVPLYVEELTKTVLESSTPDRPTVPATLHDSLLARLDRLGPAKDIAQVAAVIGQQFTYALLAAVVSYSAAELMAGLLRLVEAGLAYRSGGAGEASYSFKHALLRDVAYENLLRARRLQLHERIGRALADNFASIAESEPELLAHHFHYAGLFDLALTYRDRAGDRAVARSSYAEGVAHFTAALAEAAQLPQGPDRTRRELAVLLKLGPPITIIKGAQSPEAGEVYRHAQERAAASGDETGLFKATWGLWYNAVVGRRLDLARDRAAELIELAQKSGNDDFLLEGFHCRWSTSQFRGEVTTALEVSLEGIKQYDRARHSWMGPIFGGHDPGVCAFIVRATTLSLRGRYPEARRCMAQALSLAEDLKHPNSQAHALANVLMAAQIGGDHRAVDQYAQRLIALADKYNLPPIRAHATLLSGWALAFGSDLVAGVAAMELEYPRATAVGPLFRYYAALLAEGQVRAGRFADALTVLRPALQTISEPGVGIFVSELYRLHGVCLLGADGANEDEAMHSLRTAIDVARKQGATLLEMRAVVSLSRATIAIGRPAEGLASLRELCATLPPEFDTANLTEASDLLSSVRP